MIRYIMEIRVRLNLSQQFGAQILLAENKSASNVRVSCSNKMVLFIHLHENLGPGSSSGQDRTEPLLNNAKILHIYSTEA